MNLLFKLDDGQTEETALLGHSNFAEHYENINQGVKWKNLKTAIRKVTRDILVPALSLEFYTYISTKYQDDAANLSAAELYVIELLQDAVAEYTAWHCSRQKLIVIGDAGLRVNLDGANQSRPPTAWEIIHTFWKVMADADSHLDAALAFIDDKKRTENTDPFPNFDSEKVKMVVSKFFVSNVDAFEKFVSLSGSRRTFMALYGNLNKANKNIKAILGKDLFDFTLTRHKSNELEEKELELLELLQEYIANYALWHGLPRLSVLVEHDGVKVLTSMDGANTKQTAQAAKIVELKNRLDCDYREAERRIIGFLYTNLELFGLFKSSYRYVEEYEDDGYPMYFPEGGGVVF